MVSGFVGIVSVIVGLSLSIHCLPSMMTRCPGLSVMGSFRVGLVNVACPSVCSKGLMKVTFCRRINVFDVSGVSPPSICFS